MGGKNKPSLGFKERSILTVLKLEDAYQRLTGPLMFLSGLALFHLGTEELAHAGSGSYADACNGILLLVEGTFGALITAAAGIGAIIASAVGGFKAAWSLIVVSVGSFILRSYITLFNGDCGFAARGGIPLPATGGPLAPENVIGNIA